MNTTRLMLALVVTGALALGGCGKSGETSSPTALTVDISGLQQAFPSPEGDIQSRLAEVTMAVRYADYPAALSALQKLANDPRLTEAQKKAVNDLTEQVKKAASDAARQSP